MPAVEKKRPLTSEEIDDILSFIQPNPNIPLETAESMCANAKKSFRKQLEGLETFPKLIPKLKRKLKKIFMESLIQPGECVGIITAQSIGEKQTQTNLNSFHRAGSADKQPTVSKFSELLNVTLKPKNPSYYVYFNEKFEDVTKLREKIGNSLVHVTMKKLTKDYDFFTEKKEEPWYQAFLLMKEDFSLESFSNCISYKINMDLAYEYKITLEEIAEKLTNGYQDVKCIYSPDCFGQIDVFLDTSNITIPEGMERYVTEETKYEVYMDEVVHPILQFTTISGISGINETYFLQEDSEWLVETENTTEKLTDPKKGKNTKEKPIDSSKRFKKVLSIPIVDNYRTISNNIWDIYYTFGIEATREYMIEEFSKIMKGINLCHVMLLVDKMTFTGALSSISRYTMRKEETGPLGKCSFEETLDNLLSAGVYGIDEPAKGVSASIICGKRAGIGTGLCSLQMDMKKIFPIKEDEEEIKQQTLGPTEFPVLTKYEIARILGTRASQIANGSTPLVSTEGMVDALVIARKEYEEGVIPISIVRDYPSGKKVRISIR